VFLPTTQSELQQLGWQQADIILVTGDAYIDVPSDGRRLSGKYYRLPVGVLLSFHSRIFQTMIYAGSVNLACFGA